MPDVFAGVTPEPGEFSDFEALNTFVKSKDPRAKIALSKLTPREMTAYTQWAQTQPEASQTPKGLALASGAALAAGAAPFIPAIPGVGGAVTGSLEFGKTMLPYLAIGMGGKALGLNQGTIDAMMIALGLKGAFGKGAAGAARGVAGETAAAEEALAARGGKGVKDIVTGSAPAPSAAEMAARGKPSFPSETPSPYSRMPYGPPEAPMPPNVIRGGPATMGRAPGIPGTFGNPGQEIPPPITLPPNVIRGGPATMGRAPGKPGMIGNPEGGPITFNEPPTPPKPTGGGKPMGSGRSFTESPSEKNSRMVLEDTGRRTGSMRRPTGNGTFKEPQKAPMPEFPPGYQKGMKPEEFDRLFNDYANKNEDPALLERMRKRIEAGLPKSAGPRKTQPRKPK